MKQRFRVGGMSCAACSAHVEKSVSAVPGVGSVQVNLLAGSMAVEYDERRAMRRQLSKQSNPAAIPPQWTTANRPPHRRRARRRITILPR